MDEKVLLGEWILTEITNRNTFYMMKVFGDKLYASAVKEISLADTIRQEKKAEIEELARDGRIVNLWLLPDGSLELEPTGDVMRNTQ